MDYKLLFKRLNNFLNKKQKGGLDFYKIELKKFNFKEYPELYEKYAFILYHKNLSWFSYKKTSLKYKTARENLIEAEKIFKKILKLKPELRPHPVTLNSLVNLAQVYAIFGNKKAISLASKTYKKYHNAHTANRLADVYLRLDMKNEAEKWYKKYEQLTLKSDFPKHIMYCDLASFYKSMKKEKLFRKYFGLAEKNTPSDLKGKYFKNVLKLLK